MKKLVFLASLGLMGSALAVGPVKAPLKQNNGFYLGAALGLSIPGGSNVEFVNSFGEQQGYDDALNPGADLALRAGYRINQVRLELSLLGMANTFKINNSEFYNTSLLMVNGYYDFYTETKWSPFVGGGLGKATFNEQVDNVTIGTVNEFAAQIILGAKYQLSRNTAFDFAYHYVGYGNMGDSHNSLFNVGFNYFFI